MFSEIEIKIFLFLSPLFFVSIFGIIIAHYVRKALFYKKHPHSYFINSVSLLSNRMLWITALTLLSVFCLRYAVAGYSALFLPDGEQNNGIGQLNWLEEFTNSFIHSLQTFTMDEDYTSYTLNGKEMVNQFFGNSDLALILYDVYSSFLNIIAPVIGGAFIIDIIADIFPDLKLFVSRLSLKDKYYFSELNENSVAMARSIMSDPERRKCILIFAGAYSGKGEESTELLLEAKAMGAICIKTDIIHLNSLKRGGKNKTYIFLISKEEKINIDNLMQFLTGNKRGRSKDMFIYVFSTDRKFSFIEEKVERIIDVEKSKLYAQFNREHDTGGNVDLVVFDVEKYMEDKKSETPDFNKYLRYVERLAGQLTDRNYNKTELCRLAYDISKQNMNNKEFFDMFTNLIGKYEGSLDHDSLMREAEKSCERIQNKINDKNNRLRNETQCLKDVVKDILTDDNRLRISDLYNKLISSGKQDIDEKKKNAALNYLQYLLSKKEREIFDSMPAIIPINTMKYTAENLLQQKPLYQPLIGKNKSELTVTILGSGSIGTEMFLAVYWFGQILDCKLKINVISKEKQSSTYGIDSVEKSFEGRLNWICPEILESGKPESELLKYSTDNKNIRYSPPYMDYKYYQADVKSDLFTRLFNEKRISDTDYYIVALGYDEDDFVVADKIRKIVAEKHFNDMTCPKTVISYLIYNSELCRKLNENSKRHYNAEDEKSDIYMNAFGCLEDVYNIRNVFQDGIIYAANRTGQRYAGNDKDSFKIYKDMYSYESNLARKAHMKYKVFSAGFYEKSMFTDEQNYTENESGSLYDPAEEKFEYFAKCNVYDGKTDEEKKKLRHRLAWLEHRRWCAYMRSRGFRSIGFYEVKKFYGLASSEHNLYDHKFISLKLHPCIIECSENGILSGLNDIGYVDLENEVKDYDKTRDIDKLDELSLNIKDLKKCIGKSDDFKKWDYPEFEEY